MRRKEKATRDTKESKEEPISVTKRTSDIKRFSET
jgi:hypothetical protein